MHNFRYIIWDFDGTLFNTYPYIASVIAEIMRNNYKIDLNLEEVQEWCKIGLTSCFNKIALDFNLSLSEFQDLFNKEYWVNIESQQTPFPRAEEILQYIQKNGGKNFIVTHRGIKSLSKLLSYYGMEEYFEKIITHEDSFPNKPDPASFLYLIDEYKLPREKVIAIGDREIDIQTARTINLKSCYFNPEGKIQELADFNITNLIEIKKIL